MLVEPVSVDASMLQHLHTLPQIVPGLWQPVLAVQAMEVLLAHRAAAGCTTCCEL